jgi:dUTP pyrophosphatase
MNMQIKLLNDRAKIPTRSFAAAGLDLYSCEQGVVPPGRRQLIKTGVAVALPPGHYGQIFGRSGLAVKCGIVVLAGVIDNDYRGEIGVVILNTGDEPFAYAAAEKIAQLVVLPYSGCVPQVVEQLDDTDRSHNGFGSSGKF